MKGLANEIYALGLIFLFLISIYYIIPGMGYSTSDTLEVRIKNDIFIMDDSLKVAQDYLVQSARYSLYQAVYDNALRGGVKSKVGNAFIEHEGKDYMLWYDNGKTYPSEGRLTDDLANVTYGNLKAYTDGRIIRAISLLITPSYGKPVINSINNYSISMSATGDKKLEVKRTMESDEIVELSKESGIDVNVQIPYYAMYHEALGANEENAKLLGECTEDLNYERETACCTISSGIMESGEYCLVKVTVTSKSEFLVWNGIDVALEPVTLVFMERAARSS